MAKQFIAGAAIAFALFAVSPVGATQTDHSVLRIGVTQYPSTLHPMFDEMVAKSLVLGMSQRPIIAYDADWKPLCMLCTTLPTYENGLAKKVALKNGQHGIAATYTLKDGLFWGDGTPVTTKDVLFSWEVGKHPMSGVGNAEFFAKDIADIQAIDDHAFTITFAKEKCDFAPLGDFYALPAHLEKKIFDQDPATYKNRTLYVTDPANPGLYLGPYQVTSVENGAAILLEKNKYWHGKAPSFEVIKFRTIENSAALSANLLSGEIDYIAGELGLSLDQAIAFEKRLPHDKFDIVYKTGLTYEHIDLPVDRQPFDDKRIRQALLYATDRNAINTAIFDGRQPVALSAINPQDTVYTDDVRHYDYAPDTAAKLLDDAGWETAADGFRYNTKGEKLVVTLSTTAGNKTRETIAQAIQSGWKKLGIDTVIDNKPARVLFGDVMRERSFKGGVMYAWVSSPRNIPKTTLHSTMIPSTGNNYAGQNYSGYNNPAMDKLLDDLDTVCEEKENISLWHQLQQTYAEDLPSLPLYYRADPFITPKWLKGVKPTGHLNPSTLWVEDWSIEP